jgi:hypothetical protein
VNFFNWQVLHKGFCDVHPAYREQYVFRVAILGWRQRTIYPLGAVLSAHKGGRSYGAGLRVLSMQQRVPKLYPRAVVHETKTLVAQFVSLSLYLSLPPFAFNCFVCDFNTVNKYLK